MPWVWVALSVYTLFAHWAWQGDVVLQRWEAEAQAQGDAKVRIRKRVNRGVQAEPPARLFGAAGVQTDAVSGGAVSTSQKGVELGGGQPPGEHELQRREFAHTHVEGVNAAWVVWQELQAAIGVLPPRFFLVFVQLDVVVCVEGVVDRRNTGGNKVSVRSIAIFNAREGSNGSVDEGLDIGCSSGSGRPLASRVDVVEQPKAYSTGSNRLMKG
jgi:hypothetical protein